MHKLLPAFAFFSSPWLALASAQTQVGGPIVANTTWALSASPIEVVSNVTVGSGATLTIEAGVVVRFTGVGQRIEVGLTALGAGTLVARGSAAQPIRFTHVGATAGSWEALHFGPDTVDAQYDASGNYTQGTVLQHAIVEFGGAPSPYLGAIDIFQSSPHVASCVVQDNFGRGLNANAAAPALRIVNSAFRRNQLGGLRIAQGSQHLLRDCVMADNPAGALVAPGGGADVSAASGIRFERCAFLSNTAFGGGGGLRLDGCNNARLRDCQFVGNSTTGNSNGGGGLWLQSSDGVQLEHCAFRSNQSASPGGGLLAPFCDALQVLSSSFDNNAAVGAGGAALVSLASGIEFRNCSLRANSTTSSGGGLALLSLTNLTVDQCEVRGCSAGLDGGAVFAQGLFGSRVMSACELSDNQCGARGGGLYCDSALVVERTRITCNQANSGGGVYYRFVNPAQGRIELAGVPQTNSFNTLAGNTASQGSQLFNQLPLSNGTLNASFVCWGGIDPVSVANAVFDGLDQPSYSVVATGNQVSCSPAVCGCIATTSCVSTPNSTGLHALIDTSGSTSIAANNFTLEVSGCPAATPGLYFYAATQISAPFANGVRCVNVPAARLPVLATSAAGAASVTVNFQNLPAGGSISAGDTRYFQFWFRDPAAGGWRSDLSDALEVTFCN